MPAEALARPRLSRAARARPARALEVLWPGRLATLVLAATLLYLLIGSNPYQHGSLLDPNTGGAVLSPFNRVFWFALVGATVPLLWLRRGEIAGLVRRSWPLLVLIAWFGVTTLWALDPVASKRRYILLVCQTAIAAAILLEVRDPRRLHGAMAVSCAVVVAIDLFSWAFLPGLSQTDIGLAAIHNHKNSLGLAMLFCEFVCAPYVFTRRSWAGRAFWITIVLGGMALLVASLSKTSLGITLAAGVVTPVILGVLRTRRGWVWSTLIWTAALVALAVFAWLGWSYVGGRDPLAPTRGVTLTDRTDVWRFVLDQAAERPWGGVGFGSFWDVDPRVQPSLQTDLWFAQPDSPTNEAHNGFLDLLVTTGAIGLAAAVFVLARWLVRGLRVLRASLRSRTDGDGANLPYFVVLGLLPVLIALHNLTESSYFNTVGLFSFAVILLGLDADLRTGRAGDWRLPAASR